MATIRQSAMEQVEVMADIIEIQETVITSLSDQLAESEIAIESLEAQIRHLMSDPSLAV